MVTQRSRLLVCLGLAALLTLPLSARGAPEVNVTAGSVSGFSERLDYFPDKVIVEEATGFTVEYHGNYKIVEVRQPWMGADLGFQYVLVQKGTPAPDGYPEARIVEVPVERVVTMCLNAVCVAGGSPKRTSNRALASDVVHSAIFSLGTMPKHPVFKMAIPPT